MLENKISRGPVICVQLVMIIHKRTKTDTTGMFKRMIVSIIHAQNLICLFFAQDLKNTI